MGRARERATKLFDRFEAVQNLLRTASFAVAAARAGRPQLVFCCYRLRNFKLLAASCDLAVTKTL